MDAQTAFTMSRRTLAVILATVVLLLALLAWFGPRLLLPTPSDAELEAAGIDDPVDRREQQEARLASQNDLRNTLLQGAAGSALIIGAVATWRTLDVSRRTLAVNREQQITERFTRAVDQLANEKPSVRVGGIYALERLTKDHPPDALMIIDLLAAYVRERAAWTGHSEIHRERLTLRSPDLQAAATVLGRADSPTPAKVDLSDVDLSRADLTGADFSEGEFCKTRFAYADMEGVTFSGADFMDADLKGAGLPKSNFTRCKMPHVALEGANLSEADFTESILCYANMKAAGLRQAKLVNADLRSADLTEADLAGADLTRADLTGARLTGAEYDAATRWPNDFTPPQ